MVYGGSNFYVLNKISYYLASWIIIRLVIWSFFYLQCQITILPLFTKSPFHSTQYALTAGFLAKTLRSRWLQPSGWMPPRNFLTQICKLLLTSPTQVCKLHVHVLPTSHPLPKSFTYNKLSNPASCIIFIKISCKLL